MDDRSFDHLARALGGASTRRRALAALAGIATGLGLAGREADAKKKRRKCNPACPAGQTCRQGACACDDGGTVCGASCCTGREVCEAGACVTPPRQCIPAGEACKAVGRRCCDGRDCASGQGGQRDVACYVPAGGACETTAECVYDSTCTNGICVANPRPSPVPEPALCPPGSAPTFIPTSDAAANGKALQDAVKAASSGDTIYLAPGDYRFTTPMLTSGSQKAALVVEAKTIGIERCRADAVVNLVCPSGLDFGTRCVYAYSFNSPAGPTSLTLKGVALSVEGEYTGIHNQESTVTLENVTISTESSTRFGLFASSFHNEVLGRTIIMRGVTLSATAQNPDTALYALGSKGSISCDEVPAILANYPSTNAGNKRCLNLGGATIANCGCSGA